MAESHIDTSNLNQVTQMHSDELIDMIASRGKAIKRSIITSFLVRMVFFVTVTGAIIWEFVATPNPLRISLWLVIYVIGSKISTNMLPSEYQIHEFNALVDKVKSLNPSNKDAG